MSGACAVMCGSAPCKSGQLLWSRFLPGDHAYPEAIAMDSAGNTVVGGDLRGALELGSVQLNSPGVYTDTFEAGLGRDGKTTWGRSFGTGGVDEVHGLVVDANDNVISVGDYEKGIKFGSDWLKNAPGAYLAKLDNGGTHVWSQRLDLSGDAVATDGENIFAAGSLGDTAIPPCDPANRSAYVKKFDSAGNQLWNIGQCVDNPDTGWGYPEAMAAGADGTAVLVGDFAGGFKFGNKHMSAQSGQDGFVAKLGSKGGIEWITGVHSTGDSHVTAVAVGTYGNVMIGGDYTGTVSINGKTYGTASGRDLLLAKLDGATGAPRWTRSLVVTNLGLTDPALQGVALDAQGNIAIGGVFQGNMDLGGAQLSSGEAASFIARFDGSGTRLWSRKFKSDLGDLSGTSRTVVAMEPSGAMGVLFAGYGSTDLGAGPVDPNKKNTIGLVVGVYAP